MIALVVNVFLFLVLVWVVTAFARSYRKQTGTWKERVWATAKDSATILWAQAVIAATASINFIAMIGGVVDPGAVEQIRSSLNPEYGAALLIVVMGVTIVARLRTLGKDD